MGGGGGGDAQIGSDGVLMCVKKFMRQVVLKEKCSAAVAISRRKFGIIKIICHHRKMRKMQCLP